MLGTTSNRPMTINIASNLFPASVRPLPGPGFNSIDRVGGVVQILCCRFLAAAEAWVGVREGGTLYALLFRFGGAVVAAEHPVVEAVCACRLKF